VALVGVLSSRSHGVGRSGKRFVRFTDGAWPQRRGRLEPDDNFRGTRWRAQSVQTETGDEIEARSTPAQPSAADVAGIKALVAELLRRAPPRRES
jgi:hypothetical protein